MPELKGDNLCRSTLSEGEGWTMTHDLVQPFITESADAIRLMYEGERLDCPARDVLAPANDMDVFWIGGSQMQWKQNFKQDISGSCVCGWGRGKGLSPACWTAGGAALFLMPRMSFKTQIIFHLSSLRTSRYTQGSSMGLNEAKRIMVKYQPLTSIFLVRLVWQTMVNTWEGRGEEHQH